MDNTIAYAILNKRTEFCYIMKKDVVIRIRGCQYVDGEKGVTDMTTIGRLESIDGGYALSYSESEDSGMGDCRMELKVNSDESVVLTRTGEYNSQMVLEKGVRNLCHYKTPYGDVVFGIFASRVAAAKNGDCGRIKLGYTIDINNDVASTNEIDISFRSRGN